MAVSICIRSWLPSDAGVSSVKPSEDGEDRLCCERVTVFGSVHPCNIVCEGARVFTVLNAQVILGDDLVDLDSSIPAQLECRHELGFGQWDNLIEFIQLRCR